MDYHYTITLRPYGDRPDSGVVGIDPVECYGYWEHRNGSEGGGLWFERTDTGLELTDYDGDYSLPRPVVDALRSAGIVVDEIYNP